MRRKTLAFLALTTLAAAAAAAAGCSDEVQTSSQSTSTGTGGAGGEGGAATTTTSTGGGGGAGGMGGSGGAGGAGGGPPITCDVTPTTGVVLAVNKLYIGTTDPDDSPNTTNGWKQYGFNIDGLVSTAQSQDVCQPAAGAAPSAPYPDGNNGIDNSFGKNILPILLSLDPDPQAPINDSIQAGQFTILLHLVDLGAGQDQAPLLGRLYGGAQTATLPAFDGSDCWPVNPGSLQDPADITSATVSFDQSALAGGTWTSNGTGTVDLMLGVGGFALPLVLHEARMSFDLSAAHDGAVSGQLGGVLVTEEFAQAIRALAGSFDPSLCNGATIDSILNQIRQASDILADGTQDPGVVCDGISIGLGFKMSAVQLGSIAPPTPPVPDPCAP